MRGSLLNHHQCAASTWMMWQQPQYNGTSVLTTHQLQVERRERQSQSSHDSWDQGPWLSPSILRSFYTCTVESILTSCITAWFGNSTAGNRKALQRVVRTAHHIVGGELPSLQDIYTRRCIRKARRIINDSSHPFHRLFSLLPSGRRLRSIRSRTSRLRDSFFPQAIRLMNSQN